MNKKMIKKCIYELRHPDTNIPVYVGATINPYSRYHEHKTPRTLKRFKHNNLQIWIKSLLDEGKKPVMKIVKQLPSSFTRKQMIEVEKEHTLKVLKKHKLFNIFIGSSHTNKTKAWVIKSNSCRIVSKETKKKISNYNAKYIFEYRGEKVNGMVALSKLINLSTSAIHYKITNNIKIPEVIIARHRV